jgi:hypothetical protein
VRVLPFVIICAEMLAEAERFAGRTRVRRTQASSHDTLVGNLGELAFAEYYCGGFKFHRLVVNRGEPDFPDIEIKTSAYPFRDWLHLKVREDYAAKRQPAFYVQTIIDVPDPSSRPDMGMKILFCGFCSHHELMARGCLVPQKTKNGKQADFNCWELPIRQLHPMNELAVLPQTGNQSELGKLH